MDKKDLLLKAYLGECVPGLIHNMGNPLGALLGFVSIMREEVTWLRHDMETFTDEALRERVKESLTKIAELFDFAAHSEQSLRKAVEKMVVKCNKDTDDVETVFDLNELVRIEADVLMTSSFFKHKINKKLEYAPGVLNVQTRWRTVSQPVGSVLFRYTVALANVPQPRLAIRTVSAEEGTRIEIRANTMLSEGDLRTEPGMMLPALTIEECRDVLGALGTLEYSALEQGTSQVGFTLVPFVRKEAGDQAGVKGVAADPFTAIKNALAAANSAPR